MNREISDSFDNAFREMLEAFGVPVRIAETDVTVLANDAPFSSDLISGGVVAEGEVELKALTSHFTTPPNQGTRVLYRDRSFLVSHVSRQNGSTILTLRCRPVKGR